jgi:hypothetical protein
MEVEIQLAFSKKNVKLTFVDSFLMEIITFLQNLRIHYLDSPPLIFPSKASLLIILAATGLLHRRRTGFNAEKLGFESNTQPSIIC